MEFIQAYQTLEQTSLTREVIGTKNGTETISYLMPNNNTCTTTINNETTITHTYRICFKAEDNVMYLYVVHATNSHYSKYDLNDITSLEVTC